MGHFEIKFPAAWLPNPSQNPPTPLHSPPPTPPMGSSESTRREEDEIEIEEDGT